MLCYYQTECRIGDRGPRICRRYTGFQALVAIALDFALRLGLDVVFVMVVLGVRVGAWMLKAAVQIARHFWRIAVAAMTVIVYVVTLPFVFVNRLVARHRSRAHAARFTGKPNWGRFADAL
jgi:hypothetical protein